ncbi:hypothetical protein JL720_4697 [Aureococcus anophagefferens]|nr:hypothetical protein JL720_4697 [Aureococcus anophagefferens]
MGLVGSKCTRECAGGGGGGRDGRRTSSSPYSTPTRLSSESGGGLDASSAPSSSRRRCRGPSRSGGARTRALAAARPRRDGGGHTLRDLLRAHIAAQLRALGPEADIAAPAGCDEDLWVDIHVVDFCNEVGVLWRKVDDRCAAKCGDAPMRAGNRVYDWCDGEPVSARAFARAAQESDIPNFKGSDLGRLRARTFEAAVEMTSDAAVFPPLEHAAYPAAFRPAAKALCGRLCAIYAHMYHRHFANFVETHSHVAVNAFFKRFVVFSLRHDLIGPADLEPVAELVQNLLRTHKKPPPPPSTPRLRVAPPASRACDGDDRVLAALSEKPPQITLDFCALLRSAHGVSSVDDIEFTEYNENIEFAEEDVDARLPSMSLNFVNTLGRPGLAPGAWESSRVVACFTATVAYLPAKMRSITAREVCAMGPVGASYHRLESTAGGIR